MSNEARGKIVDGKYVFPTLYRLSDASSKITFWTQYIVVISKDVSLKINWKDSEINMYEVDQSYFDNSKAIRGIGLLYAERGYVGGKIVRNAPTKIYCGKNIGKSNETNMFMQAVSDGTSAWNKKRDAGMTPNVNRVPVDPNKIYFPMAAKKFTEVWKEENVVYPVYSQPKLDGMRALAVWDGGKLEFYSRRLKRLTGLTHHIAHLSNVLNGMPPRYFDGELYEHGVSLQKIGSIVKNEQEVDKLISYCIFDTFDVFNLKTPFADRMEYLKQMKDRLVCKKDDHTIISIVDTEEVHSRKELDILYKKYRAFGYEGQMVKFNLPYETSTLHEKRSNNVLKRKERQSAEFEIIGYEASQKGSHAGAVLFKLKAGNGSFLAQPVGMTVMEMQQLYRSIEQFPNDYIGKMATIEFEEYSDDGIPKQPKFVAVRDYE